MLRIQVVTLLLIVLAVASCSPGQKIDDPIIETIPSQAIYQTLSMDEFLTVVDNEADKYTIVNVHIPYAGEIPQTDSNVAFNDIDALTSALPDKDAPIILYCRSGNMSETATRALVDLGYTHVYDVPGGMNAWQSSGRELEFLE